MHDMYHCLVWFCTDEPEISPAGDEILTVLAGQDLKLPCEVTGHPQPYVTWEKDGESFGETINLQ